MDVGLIGNGLEHTEGTRVRRDPTPIRLNQVNNLLSIDTVSVFYVKESLRGEFEEMVLWILILIRIRFVINVFILTKGNRPV